MLYYTVAVFWVKFALQLPFWEWIFPAYFPIVDYYKLGFALAEDTHSKTFFAYTVWDILCILSLVSHEYVLIKSGLAVQTQEIEVKSAKSLPPRVDSEENLRSKDFETLEDYENISEPDSSAVEEEGKLTAVPESFLRRLIPHTSREKPGADLYTYIVVLQTLILLSIILLSSTMEGVTKNVEFTLK